MSSQSLLRLLIPWRASSRNLIGTLLSVSICVILLYTLSGLHDSAYEPSLVHQAVEAVEHVAAAPHEGPQVQDAPALQSAVENNPSYAQPENLDDQDAFCKSFPNPPNLAVILKTGATNLHAKAPASLATSLRCVKDPLIFSDLEQTLGRHRVHDALANFTPSAMENNEEFDIYRLQQQYLAEGRETDLRELSTIPIASDDWRTQGQSAAWGLDKYKFLHMVEQTWNLAPDRDWYFFVEADTYISWPNLLRWIETLDATRKSYYGKSIRIWEYEDTELYFAYGGSGFLLSGPTVKEFAEVHRRKAPLWDERIREMLYGDFVLAAFLYEELGLRLIDARPSITADKPSDTPFSLDRWCEPILTLHHIDAQQFDELYRYDSRQNGTQVLLYRDVYEASFPEGMPSSRADWSNRPGDNNIEWQGQFELEGGSAESYAACEQSCNRNEECLQFIFVESNDEPECHLMNLIYMGHLKFADDSRRWTSGWMKGRIDGWIEAHQGCSSDGISWPH